VKTFRYFLKLGGLWDPTVKNTTPSTVKKTQNDQFLEFLEAYTA
jgi:hypothetical protein